MDANHDNTTDTIIVNDMSGIPIAPPPMESANWMSMVPMVLIFIVIYFLLIRPQEKKRRLQENLVSGVKIGEEIMTNSGLFGRVITVNDSNNTVMIEIAKDVEVKILKTSILDIVSRNAKLEDNVSKKQIADKLSSSKKNKKK